MTPILGFTLALTLVCALFGVVLIVRGSEQRESLATRSSDVPLTGVPTRLYDRFGAWVDETSWGSRIAVRLEQGGLPYGATDYVLATLGLGVVAFYIFLRIVPFPFAVALSALLMWIGWLYVKRRQAQRQERFIRQLADVARILSGAASAGLSVGAGIAVAGRELGEPAASEMRLMAERLSIGGTLEQAVDELRQRVPSREVGILIGTLVIQQRAGGDTVRSLADIAVALEDRSNTLQDAKAILSRALNATYLLPAIAIAGMLLSNKAHEDNVRHIFSSLFGIIAMLIASLFIGAGIAIARRLARVEQWDVTDDESDPDGSWDQVTTA